MPDQVAGYLRPSDEVVGVVDGESLPSTVVDPSARWCIVLGYRQIRFSVEELAVGWVRTAGLSFHPLLRVPERSVFAESISIRQVFEDNGPVAVEHEGRDIVVQGLDKYVGFRYFNWHPAGDRFIFSAKTKQDTLELMMVELDPSRPGSQQTFVAKSIVNDRTFNAFITRPFSFIGDGSYIVSYVAPQNQGPPPADENVPTGPNIKDNTDCEGKKKPKPTYTHLISSKHDEELYEYYSTTEVMLISVDGFKRTVLNPGGGMIRSVSLSPNKERLLVSVTRKPFSWSLKHGQFAERIEVWNLDGQLSLHPLPNKHVKSLTEHPVYPPRGSLDSPLEFTHDRVFDNDRTKKPNGWADPPKGFSAIHKVSFHGPIIFGDDGRPRNPVGKTGITGRGVLGKWGPNHAGDAMVTRKKDGKNQVLAIRRKDTGEWALPGGMVDDGETAFHAIKREFIEEVVSTSTHEDVLDRIFSRGRLIYKGYVDDPRNTDNAWIESTFVHFQCDDVDADLLALSPATDETIGVGWIDLDEDFVRLENWYANHQAFLLKLMAGGSSRNVSISNITTVADIPDTEDMVISFDAKPAGPRSFCWHGQKPDTLLFRFALDKGDPSVKIGKDGFRDSLYELRAPYNIGFTLEEPIDNPLTKLVLRTQYRLFSISFSRPAARPLIFVSEIWRKTRRTRVWVIQGDKQHILTDRAYDDAYSSPGVMYKTLDENGLRYCERDPITGGFEIFGEGASPIGSRPFYDRLFIDEDDISKFHRERIYRCPCSQDTDIASLDLSMEVGGIPPTEFRETYEYPVALSPGAKWMLLSRESKVEPPDLFWRNVETGREIRTTHTEHPQKSLLGVQKKLIRYTRSDGLQLSADLYLPKGYDPERDGPRPCLLWAYPREFKTKSSAGQVKTSPYQFLMTSWSRPVPWVLKGWVVLDKFATPIVGEGDEEPNDTFIEQLTEDSRAAIEELIRRGVGKKGRFCCWRSQLRGIHDCSLTCAY
uniref:Nudix hydrolase domain-containing protein n=1 Tax=Mucochytrium quahogii TaxID=96639 RepID=A0A7S2WS91_9STRA|mmetsp:Transcript_7534/g.16418  ORF Transcript_7534/g.16418 Transcript_7534/m.16418 type:complete len:987 (+) Transcript_7534:102-3062(+)